LNIDLSVGVPSASTSPIIPVIEERGLTKELTNWYLKVLFSTSRFCKNKYYSRSQSPTRTSFILLD